LSNEEKRMIMKKGGGSREKGEEETKSMPYAPVYKMEKLEKNLQITEIIWICNDMGFFFRFGKQIEENIIFNI
jgi:hypothetical protein